MLLLPADQEERLVEQLLQLGGGPCLQHQQQQQQQTGHMHNFCSPPAQTQARLFTQLIARLVLSVHPQKNL
jgi:hypothetical protein